MRRLQDIHPADAVLASVASIASKLLSEDFNLWVASRTGGIAPSFIEHDHCVEKLLALLVIVGRDTLKTVKKRAQDTCFCALAVQLLDHGDGLIIRVMRGGK